MKLNLRLIAMFSQKYSFKELLIIKKWSNQNDENNTRKYFRNSEFLVAQKILKWGLMWKLKTLYELSLYVLKDLVWYGVRHLI